jgi:hypothetical protein
MRALRDAKAMARTLRAILAAKGVMITIRRKPRTDRPDAGAGICGVGSLLPNYSPAPCRSRRGGSAVVDLFAYLDTYLAERAAGGSR